MTLEYPINRLIAADTHIEKISYTKNHLCSENVHFHIVMMIFTLSGTNEGSAACYQILTPKSEKRIDTEFC